MLGPHTNELTQGGLIDRNSRFEMLTWWPQLFAVVHGGGYAVIRITESQLVPIPERAFDSIGAAADFAYAVHARIDAVK
ncbi:MAG: hypothetical protein ACHREM_22030 [Polyangiales bacterium]